MSDLRRTARASAKRARLGQQARCVACGETDIRVLQASQVTLCAECRLAMQGKRTAERHHPAGQHNDPIKIPLPANDHATFTDGQCGWPATTLRNPYQDPLVRLAAWPRFFVNLFCHLSEQAGDWARLLEDAASRLDEAYGPRWFTANERAKPHD